MTRFTWVVYRGYHITNASSSSPTGDLEIRTAATNLGPVIDTAKSLTEAYRIIDGWLSAP